MPNIDFSELDQILGVGVAPGAEVAVGDEFAELDALLGVEGIAPPIEEAPIEAPPDVIEEAPRRDISVYSPWGAAFAEEPQAAPQAQILKELAKPEVFRPILEAGGLVVGGALVAPAALAAGPFAPAVGVGGAAVGFTVATKAADIAEAALGVREPISVIQEVKEIPEDLFRGVKYELGGRAIGALGGVIFRNARALYNKMPAFSRKRLEQKAGEVLRGHTSEGVIYAENTAQARAIEKRIPGIRFTKAQITKDPKIIQLERAIELEQPQMLLRQRAESTDILRQHLDEAFPEGVGFEAVVDVATAQQRALRAGTESAQDLVEAELSNLSRGMDIQASGRALHASLQGLKTAAKEKATRLYENIPNVHINITDLKKDFINLLKPTIKGEPSKNVPEVLRGVIKQTFGEDPTLGFQDLRGLRTLILNEKRALQGSAAPNPSALMRLEKAQSAIEKTINSMEGIGGDAANAFRQASAFYKTYSQQFKQGTVADVLRKGSRGEDIRIGAASVADRFFKNLDTADDFIRTAGGDIAAKGALRDFASQDLLKTINPATGEIVPGMFNRWLTKNKAVLDRLGLTGEFAGVKQAQRMVDSAKGMQENFNKSIASKIIGVDAEQAFATAFAGKGAKQTGQVARDLVAMVKGDKQAEAGLKKALKDHILTRAQTAGIDIMNNPIASSIRMTKLIKQFEPAMRVLYKNEPKKLQALMDVQKSYQILERNIKSPIASGSDTVEKLIAGTALGATGVITGKWAAVNFTRAIHGMLNKYSEEQMQFLVAKAILDPDYAQIITRIAKEKMAPKMIEKLLDNRFLTVPGLYGAKKLSEDEPEEQFEVEGY